jgi:hypothetical protein
MKSLWNKAITVVYSGDADFRSATLSLPRLTTHLAAQLPAIAGSLGAKSAGVISPRSASYNLLNHAATLTPAKPAAREPAQLVINSTGANCLQDTRGRYIDGGKNALVYPASGPVVHVELSARTKTQTLSTSTAIDAVLERETFVGLGRLRSVWPKIAAASD